MDFFKSGSPIERFWPGLIGHAVAAIFIQEVQGIVHYYIKFLIILNLEVGKI